MPMPDHEINESRYLRGASALIFSSQSKKYGEKVVKHAKNGISKLQSNKLGKSDSERLDALQDAQIDILNSQIALRHQIGSLVGIALTSTLIAERNSKEIREIIKGK
tara:strand:+ start:68 stop:388 length:321 start_codon:yes stop_codon:yes gene_type:complete